MTISTILAVAATALSVLLTITLAGALRRLTEIQMRLRSGGSPSPASLIQIPVDSYLPKGLVDELSEPTEAASVLAVLSDDCEGCDLVAQHLEELCRLPINVVHVGDRRDVLRSKLPTESNFLSDQAGRELLSQYGIRQTPVVIIQKDGRVVTSGFGQRVQDRAGIADLLESIEKTGA